jgi:hypothetical protein
MNQQQRAAVQQALEALEKWDGVQTHYRDRIDYSEPIAALRQLLEQPPAWVGLTDEDDIVGTARDAFAVRYCALPVPGPRIKAFASAIEAKLREKNGGKS